MKLLKIEDYGLNTYKFHFEDSYSCLAYIEDKLIHVIEFYKHGNRDDCDFGQFAIMNMLEWFYTYNEETWRPRTFKILPHFKKVMKHHL